MGDVKSDGNAGRMAWRPGRAFILRICRGHRRAGGVGPAGMPAARKDGEAWGLKRLPLGTFICIGGIVSAFCGHAHHCGIPPMGRALIRHVRYYIIRNDPTT